MTHLVTLNLPDRIYDPFQRIAEATQQPVETLLLNALRASLPPLDDLPADLANELIKLETLSDEALWKVMIETVPTGQQEVLGQLLRQNQARVLTEAEQQELEKLQRAADLVMLRKARAAVLLRFRGQRVPTLAELRQLTPAAA